MFETTVLFSAVGMVITFCYLCQLAPFVRKHHFHPRATDDKFVMVIDCSDRNNDFEVTDFMNGLGATEVNVQYAETGWWLGRYDREQKLIAEGPVSH
jgi:hypothetical protein